MLRIDMTPRSLANTRFVISPLHIAADTLWLTRPAATANHRGWGPMVRDALHEHRLTVLHSLFSGSWRYLPDFLQPEPQSHEDPIERELHGVATTDPGRIAAELALMLDGRAELGLAGGSAQRPLLEAMERGEQAFAGRVAGELHRLWEAVIGPRWPTLRARAENDIAHRVQVIGRYGLGNGLGVLHPSISWHLPTRPGTAAGVTLGLAVSVGGLAAPLFGLIAQHQGPEGVLTLLPVIPLPAVALGSFMVEPGRWKYEVLEPDAALAAQRRI